MPIEIEIKNDGITAALQRLGAIGGDNTAVMESLGQTLVGLVRGNFKGSHDPYGSPWPALKSRQGQPLKKSGLLRDSITHQVNGPVIRIGTVRKYAAIHQFGGLVVPTRGPTYVPNRTLASKIRQRKKDGSYTKGKKLTIRDAGGYLHEPMLAFKIGGKTVFARKVTIPARPFFPNAAQGLPESWSAALVAAIEKRFTEAANAG